MLRVDFCPAPPVVHRPQHQILKLLRRVCLQRVQRYLAHEKQRPPRTLQWEYVYGPMAALREEALFNEQGTPRSAARLSTHPVHVSLPFSLSISLFLPVYISTPPPPLPSVSLSLSFSRSSLSLSPSLSLSYTHPLHHSQPQQQHFSNLSRSPALRAQPPKNKPIIPIP